MKKQKEYTFWESAKRIFSPLKKYNKGYVYLGLISLQGGINGMIYIWAIKLITEAIQVKDVAILWRIFMLLLIIYLLSFIARYFWRHRGRFADIAIKDYLREKYFKAYLLLDNNYVEAQGLGRMQSIASAGISSQASIIGNAVSSLRSVSTLIASMILLATTSQLALGYMIFICVFTIFNTYLLSPKQTIRRRKFSDNSTEQSKYTIRFLMSKTEILQNAKYEMEMNRFRDYKKNAEGIIRKMSAYGFPLWEVPGFFVDALRFAIPLLAISVIKGSSMTLPDIVLLLGMVGVMDGVVQTITGTYRNTIESFNDIEKLWMTFDNAPRIRGYDDGKDFHFQEGNISLKDIHFNYGKGEVIKDFSLTIKGGEKTAFVGISGSGKSTLIKLIAGYIHPQKGEVIIDNQLLPNETNKNYVSLRSYYNHIGYLTQEPNVFDGTIYENLTYALDHEPTEEELNSAINGAQCQFIYEFPDGVQTEIGEKGIKLSGGQRQRLAIAKVMLKNPQIILLDEPTSALDSFSEEEVTKAFNNLFQGRTVVVIAHRLQTVKKADRIIVLDHGKIVEEGNHDSLVKSGGVYAKMLELQSGF